MTPYYLDAAGQTALLPLPPRRSCRGGCDQRPGGRYSSVLLSNHGPVVAGETLEAAVFATEELEETAKLYLLLRGHNPITCRPRRSRIWPTSSA